MKKLSKLFVLFLVFGSMCIVLPGCNMDLAPEDQLSTESYFMSATELQEYTNYFYRLLPDPETMYAEEGEHFVAPTPSDLVRGTRDYTSGNGYWSTSVWKNLRKINYYLANSHRCHDMEAREHYDGVAYFFRAYFYFGMLQKFGAVPVYTESIDAADAGKLNQARDGRDVVTNRIIADLDSAIAKLPASKSVYEVNRYTAMALKSRVCLFEGTFRKYHASDAFNGGSAVYPTVLPYEDLLKQCVIVSRELMNAGYSLYATGTEPYFDLFAQINAPADEIIWGRAYSVALDIKHNAQAWSVARQTGFTKRFMNLYLNADGTRFTDRPDYTTVMYVDEIVNRDPRLLQTVMGPQFIQKGATAPTKLKFAMSVTGYKYVKYLMDQAYNTWGSSVNYMPIFRLGEVYLNYAEALAELGTLAQSDLDASVNHLRDRVGMPHMDMAQANANPDPYMAIEYGFTSPILSSHPMKGILLEIRRERMVETPLEGLHYWDVMRWKEGHLFTLPRYGQYFPGEGSYDLTGDGKNNVNFYTTTKHGGIGVECLQIDKDVFFSEGTQGYLDAYHGQEFSFDEGKDYLYPIPVQERTLTNGKLSQNPGWVDGTSF